VLGVASSSRASAADDDAKQFFKDTDVPLDVGTLSAQVALMFIAGACARDACMLIA
jgi:hypothetical protein